jgi:hypothetical protein
MSTRTSTSRTTATPYVTDHATSCLFVEVYLPKHVRNQGALIDLLLDVIELDKARAELRRRATGLNIHVPVRQRVAQVHLYGVPAPAARSHADEIIEIIDKISEGLIGYSIYEVDGAFHDRPSDQAPAKAADRSQKRCSRTVQIRRSDPFSIPKDCACAFSDEPADSDRALLMAHLKSYPPPPCEGKPKPEAGPTIEVELPDGIYLLELVSDDETSPEVVATKCLRLFEERTLVVRFLIDLKSMENQAITATNGSSETTVTRVIEALLLIGEYLVRELGETVATEDQLWIYYDVGHLWKWYKGEPQRPPSAVSNSEVVK